MPRDSERSASMSYLKAAITERQTEVAALARSHYSAIEIAKRLGVTPRTVSNDLAVLRAQWRERREVDTDEWVASELERLAVAERAIWPQVERGKLVAIDRLLAIMDRRARYLGLDANPTQNQQTTVTVQVAYLGADGEPLAPPPGTVGRYLGGEAVQRGLLRSPVGEDGAGTGPLDPSRDPRTIDGVVLPDLQDADGGVA